ncbi:MAG: ATP-binding protein [Vulcanimicrobiaceae bacterium]|jgi:ABC-type molybdate transport system ATPase subunit
MNEKEVAVVVSSTAKLAAADPFASLPNPYDFSRPIREADQLIGREAQLGDIQYYLDALRLDAHSVNLAVIGESGSGKTSILNVAEKEALSRGLLVFGWT